MRKKCMLVLVVILIATLVACAKPTPTPTPTPTQSSPKPIIKWRAGLYGPPGRSNMEGVEWWSQEVGRRSGGRLTIETIYNEQLAPTADILLAVSNRAFEVGHFTSGVVPGLVPIHTVMNLPFLLPLDIKQTAEIQLAAMRSPLFEAELSDRWHAKAVQLGTIAPYELMGKGKPVKTVDDLRGMRIRMGGEVGKIIQKFGAVAVMQPGPEMFEAYQRGSMDAILTQWTWAFSSYGVDKISDYATLGVNTNKAIMVLFVNANAFTELPSDIQQIVLQVGEEASYRAQAYEEENPRNIAAMKERGVKFYDFPPEERAKLVQYAVEVWDGWIKDMDSKGLHGREVFDFIAAQIQKVTGQPVRAK